MTSTVLVINHYLRGDLNNALGIARAIACPVGHRMEIVDASLRARILVPLLNRELTKSRALNAADRQRRLQSKWWLYFRGDWPKAINVSAVVSTLGRGEAPGAYLAHAFDAPAIHLGSAKIMRRSDFDLLIAHQGIPAKEGEAELPVSPSPYLREDIQAAGERYLADKDRDRRRLALLLGGNVKGLTYSTNYWHSVMNAVGQIAQDQNASWLITTSPRTPRFVAHLLHRLKETHGRAIESVVIFGVDKSPSLAEIIGASTAVFATCETVSMISDAVANGKPVLAITENGIPQEPRIGEFLRRQAVARRILLANAERLGREPIEFHELSLFSSCWSAYLHRAMADKGIDLCSP